MGIKRVGFDLEPVPAPPGEPWYVAATRQSSQAVMDQQYLKALAEWYDRADGWVEGQSRMRDSSVDPKGFLAAPFASQVPRREVVVGWSEAEQKVLTGLAPVDPRIPRPELPAPVAPTAPGAGIHTLGPPAAVPDERVMQALGAIYAKLTEVLAEVKR